MGKIIEVKFEDHKEEVLAAAKEKIYGWLQAVGEDAASTAANVLTMTDTIDSGRLKNSINWATQESYGDGDAPQATPEANSVYIGTNVDYAVWHEFGTGKYAESGGRQTPWMFQDKDGEWHWTHGVPAKHYIQFGMTAHQSEYKNMLEQAMKE